MPLVNIANVGMNIYIYIHKIIKEDILLAIYLGS